MSSGIIQREGKFCQPPVSWTEQPLAQTGFLISAYATLIVFLLTLGAVLLGDALFPNNGRVPISWLAFALFFTCILVGCVAEVYLWVGMLFFFFQVDRRSFASRGLWLVALIGANAWAAAVYYFVVYRQHTTEQHFE